MHDTRFVRAMSDLRPGDHLCCIHGTEEGHQVTLTAFLRQGLERGEKVLYIVDADTTEVSLGYMRDEGLDLEPYLARGQLVMLSRDDAYMREGIFDSHGMIDLLRAETNQALAEGYPALRAIGEMTWALRGLSGSERLMEYEAQLSQLLPESQCLALCQYDRLRFDPAVLLDVLRTHPIAVVGTEVYDNVYYIPPAGLLGGDFPAAELEYRVQSLAERKRAARALRESQECLDLLYQTVGDAIFTVAMPERRIEYVNQATYAILGYAPEEMIGQTTRFLYPDEAGFADYGRRLADALAQGRPAVHAELELQRKDGSQVWCDVHTTFLLAEGAPRRVISVVRDITERKRAEEEKTTVSEILRALNAMPDVSAAFPSVAASLKALTGCERVSLALLDANREWVTFVALDQPRPEFGQGTQLHVSDSVVATSPALEDIRAGRLHLTPDLAAEADSPAEQALYQAGYRSRINLPLRVGEQIIGALNLSWTRPAGYSTAQLPLLTQIAEAVALAAEKSRLFEAERRRREQAETLRAANLALTQALDLTAVLETLLDYLHRLVPYDRACVMLLETGSRLAVRTVRDADNRADLERIRTSPFDVQAYPGLQGLLAGQESVQVSDVTDHPGWKCYCEMEDVRSWLGIPLVAAGKVIGLFSVEKAEPGFFTGEHRRLAETLAGQAAVAIQNTRLFEQVRAGRERLQALSHRLVEVQESERRRLARELHDQIGQALTAVKLNLQALGRLSDASTLTPYLEDSISIVERALQRARNLALDLRPSVLDDLGLVPALRWYLDRQAQRADLAVEFAADPLETRLPPMIETVCFRVAQEALTNVVRHAEAQRVCVELRQRDGELHLIVRDDGVGFDVPEAFERAARSASLGLLSMRERVELAGGRFEMDSAPGRGTEVHARFGLTSDQPLERRKRKREDSG